MNLIEKMKEYLKEEYKFAEEIMKNRPSWVKTRQDEKIVIDKTISRCLGVVMFTQTCGVPYEECAIYDEYKEKLEKLLDK